MILLAVVSLDITVPFALDQLDHHNAMQWMGCLENLLLPGDSGHPLVILDNQFVPFKLMLRTLTIAIIFIWCMLDIIGKWTRLKPVLVAILIFSHVILPAGMLIRARLAAQNHALAHDGGTIQIEEAMKMLLAGRNPYTETYHDTPLENWRGFSNNIVYHLPYMPGAFVYSIPAFVFARTLGSGYDQRVLHMLFFMISLILIGVIVQEQRKRLMAWLVFALNPFFSRYFILGTNDIVVIFWLLMTLALTMKKHYTSAFLSLSAACCTKQFAWFFVPFFAVIILDLKPLQPRQWLTSLRLHTHRWIPGLLLAILTIAPFLFWDITSFIDDTFRYGSGGLPTSYPMQGFHGYGFATLPLFLRWVPNGSASFPFAIVQFATAIPLFVFLWFRFSRQTGLAEAVTFPSLILLDFMFFSRYLHGNFVGFIFFWPILGWCMQSCEDVC